MTEPKSDKKNTLNRKRVSATKRERGEILRKEEREQNRTRVFDRITDWLSDGDTVVAVFENVDFGSRALGARIALPYALAVKSDLRVGHTSPPDSPRYGLGWRFKCQLVSRDPGLLTDFITADHHARTAH